jgi:hypothetical protein
MTSLSLMSNFVSTFQGVILTLLTELSAESTSLLTAFAIKDISKLKQTGSYAFLSALIDSSSCLPITSLIIN